MLDPAELTGWFEAHAARLVLYARFQCGIDTSRSGRVRCRRAS